MAYIRGLTVGLLQGGTCLALMVKLWIDYCEYLGENGLINKIATPCQPGLLSFAPSKLRLCSANDRAGYFSNLACDWLGIVWAYSKQEAENGPSLKYI